jgi:hypothetical protein
MLFNISGVVALACFTSIAMLPWWLLANPQAHWGPVAGAFLTWLVLGVLAVSVRDGSTRRENG